jgi:uncharacterized protein YjiS (DUF1127 family)
MSEISLDYYAAEIALRPIGKMTTPSVVKRWWSRRRLRSSIAHLDDRLLADVGFSRRDLGFSERLMRQLGRK